MPNITLSVDEQTIRRVRKAAIDRRTTLTQMVRDFLTEVAQREESDRRRAMDRLDTSFVTCGRDMGKRMWTREALHER